MLGQARGVLTRKDQVCVVVVVEPITAGLSQPVWSSLCGGTHSQSVSQSQSHISRLHSVSCLRSGLTCLFIITDHGQNPKLNINNLTFKLHSPFI